jgi:HK97 family phage prohead protease
MAKTRSLPIVRALGEVDNADKAKRTATVIWTAGATVRRVDFWTDERYDEELVVSDKAVRLDRLNGGAPLLDSHFVYGGVEQQLGVVERAWLEKGKGMAEVRFPVEGVDENADRAFAKMQDGILRNISVGYRRLKIEVDKSKEPVLWRVIDWEPFEISLVTVPADPAAQVVGNRGSDPVAECQFVDLSKRSLNGAALARMRMRQAAARF